MVSSTLIISSIESLFSRGSVFGVGGVGDTEGTEGEERAGAKEPAEVVPRTEGVEGAERAGSARRIEGGKSLDDEEYLEGVILFVSHGLRGSNRSY